MTLFAVLFEDEIRNADEIRRQHMPAHLEFLRRNGASIRAAGPLRQVAGEAAGGLWLVGLCIAVDLLCHGVSWSALALAERMDS